VSLGYLDHSVPAGSSQQLTDAWCAWLRRMDWSYFSTLSFGYPVQRIQPSRPLHRGSRRYPVLMQPLASNMAQQAAFSTSTLSSAE
jgi:hypothetical protein